MNKRCVIWCAVSSEEQAKDDKLSLSTQESEMREYAQAQGWDVVHVFMWDGYSRWESDPIAALEDFAEQGRFEYHELRRMWRERAFDVLLLYTHSRAGRSFTMQSWVVENVIRHGGEIYRIHGGWINKRDYAFQIGIGGVLSTADIDRLIEQRFHAMNQRASQGLPTTSKPPLSHLVRRDELGKPLTDQRGHPLPMIVDTRLRRLWDDAAALLLEGVSFKALEIELYKRFGHVDASGKPYASNTVRSNLLSPGFWGHSARHYKDGRKHGWKIGAWVYDDTLPAPDGVLLHRNTHEAVYTGERADQVRAELRRRETVARGRSSSYASGRFTGLFICGECTYYFGYSRKGKYSYLYCGARNVGVYRSRMCNQQRGLTERQAQDFIDALLRQALDTDLLASAFDEAALETVQPMHRAELIRSELADLEEQAQRLVLKQATAPDTLSHIYDAEIKRIGERHVILRNQVEQAQYIEAHAKQQAREEQSVLGELRDLGLPTFWSQPDQTVNQLLHRLMGTKRFIVLDGEILRRFGTTPPEKRA